MSDLLSLPPAVLAAAFAVVGVAGFVKGAVGFAMPMLIIAGLGSFLAPETTLAALILPTLATNLWQALRQGWRPAWRTALRFRVYLGVLLVCLVASAQLVRVIAPGLLFLLLGTVITGFALFLASGARFHIAPKARLKAELGIGAMAGAVGGLSGVWGPQTVAYLTALDTEKTEQMRAQGVIYGVGAVALLAAHIRSGVLNGQSAPLSALLLLPALGGMVLGMVAHDRLPQAAFRRATLAVLVLAGLNLIRRGLTG